MKVNLRPMLFEEFKNLIKTHFFLDKGYAEKSHRSKITTAVLLFACNILYGQTVSLDNTFAGVGIKDSIMTGFDSRTHRIKLLPNDQIIGLIGYDNPSKGLLVKLTPSGSYDNSFGTNGKVFFGTSTPDFRPIQLLIQPDNKIIAIGAGTAPAEIRVYRFLSNGSPDNTFGNNGEVFISTVHDDTTPYDACLLPNGKIVICGVIANAPNFIPRGMAIRLNTNGGLDNTFSNNGLFVSQYGLGSHFETIAALPDNQILLGGFAFSSTWFGMLVSKRDSVGLASSNFGNAGNYFNSGNPGSSLTAARIDVQPNGEVIIGTLEHVNAFNHTKSYVLNLNSNGTVNTNFGNSGKHYLVSNSHNQRISAISLQANGKINLLTVNSDSLLVIQSQSIHRVNANGTSDLNFNTTSEKEIFIMNNDMNHGNLAIQSDGKIVVCGSEFIDTVVSPQSAIVARYEHTPPPLVKNVTVTTPNGGENWNITTNKNVQWSATSVNKVNVFYKIDNAPRVSIASNINNTGSTAWLTPTLTSNKYKIIVQDASDWSILDSSNTHFSISDFATIGIGENNFIATVDLLPNPTDSYLDIRSGSEESVHARITNESGQAVDDFYFSNTVHLSTSEYKPGIYFITLSGKEYNIIRKFIIVR